MGHVSMGEAIFSAVKPIFKIYLIIGVGFLLARVNILTAAATKSISDIVLVVLLPCLSFNKIVTSIEDDDIKYVGICCLSSVIIFATGCFFAWVVRRFFPVPKKWYGGILAGGMFPNISDLPIAYLQTMDQGTIFTEEQGEKGVSYVIIFLAMFLICVFNLGGFRLIEMDFEYQDEESAVRSDESSPEPIQYSESDTDESTLQSNTDQPLVSKLGSIHSMATTSILHPVSVHTTNDNVEVSKNMMQSPRSSYSNESIDSQQISHLSTLSSTPRDANLLMNNTVNQYETSEEKVIAKPNVTDDNTKPNKEDLFKSKTQPNSSFKQYLKPFSSATSGTVKKVVSAYSTGSIYNKYHPHDHLDPLHRSATSKSSHRRPLSRSRSHGRHHHHRPVAQAHELVQIYSHVNQYGEEITPLYSQPLLPTDSTSDSDSCSSGSESDSNLDFHSRHTTSTTSHNSLSRHSTNATSKRVDSGIVSTHGTTSPVQKYRRNELTRIITSDATVSKKDIEASGNSSLPGMLKKINLMKMIIFFLKNCLRPVSLAVILGLIICFIPWVKGIFVKAGAPHVHEAPDGQPVLSFIMDFTSYVGAASVPFGLLLLGATLGRLKITKLYPGFWKSAVILVVLRQCVMPIFGVLWCDRLVKAGWVNWEKDGMLLFVIVINWGLPTMTTLIYFTASYTPIDCEDPVQMECVSFFLMLQYPLLVVSLPFLVTYFLKVQMNL
ncbi:hypothetical protein TBLA_0B01790 [Henningerozyma blattae CBS 6284]|uniref:Protein ECM3 n=1 Tax=Henningerozyma blattae (strain ATCC 34711 / CBS 6284 / DSM 70876 / NBRC 10599 / NRRL Y-10934 / UCD 77-7) TaxID=1071380 RepID=I2GY21_HENB6|nr:hypothetical protein TBLA_0B01790 [Tetrapisispora blattae CBS 6284]CCH59023.1 hypothetical protein TBLA_0B01790 [Tetrapisispora blattae CBS 6284]